MKLALFGRGKMGRLIEVISASQGHQIVPPETADVCLDFSHPSVVFDHLEKALALGKPIVIGTTGWDERLGEAQARVIESGTALYSPNFSIGVAIFMRLVAQARKIMPRDYDVAGVEWHHREKQDVPSGTAKKMNEALGGIPISSVRCGQMPGRHTVLFDSACDTITVTHEARNREGLAYGALAAAEWIIGKQGWLTFENMVRDLYCTHHAV